MLNIRVLRVGIFSLIMLSLALSFTPPKVSANTKVNDCTETIYSSFFTDLNAKVQGTVYVKMAAKLPNSNLSVYFQDNIDSNSCFVVGQAAANTESWSAAGSINQSFKRILVQGPEKSADIYQATVKMLILPDSKICSQVDSECRVTYQGKMGVLQPKLLSGATDNVAIYTVQPIDKSSISQVSYYSDGNFLYSDPKKQITEVNRNYLADGKHSVSTQVIFANGQKWTYTQDIDMGNDYTGFTTLRSYYYKSHNRYLYVIAGVTAFLIISLIIMIIRAIHQRRLYKQEHGYDQIKYTPKKKDDNNDQIVVG